MKKFILLSIFCAFCALPLSGKTLATGDNAPHIPSPVWLDGKIHRIADYKNKKPVVLFIWNLDQRALIEFQFMNKAAKNLSKKAAFLGIGSGTVDELKKFPGCTNLQFPVCADHNRATAKLYMRSFDRLPLAVVIDRNGKVNWRGSIRQVPAILKLIQDGKFDLAERIRTEKFSNAVSTAVKAKEFEKATALIREEWEKHPENLELLSMHLLISARHLKKYDEAFKLIETAHKRVPGTPGVYELEFQVITASGKNAMLIPFARRVIAAHGSNPQIMVQFASHFSRMSAKDMLIPQIHAFLQAGWRKGKFKNNVEKANFAIDYAKLLHSFGRTDLAYKLALLAEQKLKGKAKRGASEAVIYYKKIIDNAPKLDL